MRIFIFFTLLLGCSVSAFSQRKDTIPNFSKLVRMESNESFTRDSLNMGNRQVFILFDPGCGHCQELGQGLAESLDRVVKSVDIYFVSMQPKEQVDGYINMFAPGLGKDSRVHFLFDPEGEFILNFNPRNFPSTYIYEEESGFLINHIDGEGKMEEILPHLTVAIGD